jgi:hypothetical protein
MLWTARPDSEAQERRSIAEMVAARAVEYRQVRDAALAARTAEGDQVAAAPVLRRLRAELRRVERRDLFPPPEETWSRLGESNPRPTHYECVALTD